MALQTKSISANGSKGHHKLTLTVTENSTSTANNTSSISWSFKLSPISSGWDWNHTNTPAVSYTVTINGTKYTGDIMSYDGSSTVTVKSGTATISHNADGDKTISFSFSVTSTNYSYLVGSASASGSMALTNIPRKATLLTATNFTDSKSPSITYSNPAGTAASELKAGIFTTDGQHAYVAYRDLNKTGSSYTFTLTSAEKQDLLNACANSNSIQVRFYIRTKIGSNSPELHYLTKTFSVGSANPIVTGSVVDTNATTIALTGNSSKLIRYCSNAKATMTATAQKGAAIDESLYIIRNGNSSAYSTSHTFNNVESNTFTFQAEDSRGNIGTDVVEPDMVEYIKPTCNIVNNRPDAVGNMTVACSGSYFNGSFGAAENTLTVQYRYKVTGGTYGSWTDMDVTPYTNSYYASASFSGLEQMKSYTFQTRAVDKLSTANSVEYTAKSTPIFHWGENDFVFEVPVTFNAGTTNGDIGSGSSGGSVGNEVSGNLNVTGDLRLKGTGNYGNTLRFGDGDYCYIKEATDDAMTIKATKINLEANSGVFVGGYAVPNLISGTWSPSLNSSAVSSYTTQYGWYMKMNQTVTVGFFVKATCRSGYDTTNITISGLPFTPLFSAAGGGMCSGAYVSGGYDFQCYVAETSGSITTRVQACNNTSATNIGTSASGCCYRSGGGELTLSGTITFMANS